MIPPPHHPPSSRLRLIFLGTATALLITFTALLLMPIAVLTLFRARRLYAGVGSLLGDAVLRLWGIRMAVHREAGWPKGQVVYVSNHPCTIDIFMLVALRMPNTRFFLAGFLRKFIPLGIIARLMGTFFTVPQNRPAERVLIFQRADRILRRTGESVYLSPEGRRVATGDIGPFNKGAFHLATSLRAPIVPIHFYVPPEVDPGLGIDAHPGTVDITIHAPIDTSDWRLEDVMANKEKVRDLFVAWHDKKKQSSRSNRLSFDGHENPRKFTKSDVSFRGFS